MSDFKTEREFYLKHIFGIIKGRIQILNRNKQEIGYLKITPLSKTYPLHFHDSNDIVLTIIEKRFSTKFELYWGQEIVDSQYIGSVKKEKSALKNLYIFMDGQNNETLRITSNLSGSKMRIDEDLKMKKKGKHTFHIKVKPTTSDSRKIVYLALSSYLVLLFDLQNTA